MIQQLNENGFGVCAGDPVMSPTACEAKLEGDDSSVAGEAPPVCRAAAA